jgi:hypothetical protein
MGELLFKDMKTRRLFYRGVLFIGDALCVALGLRLAYLTRFHWTPFMDVFPVTKGFPLPEIYLPIQGTALGIWVLVFMVSGFYQRINLFSFDEFIRVSRGVFVGWILVLAATFLYRGVEYSRLVLAASGVYTLVLVFAFRKLMKLL